jgi:hypothetical protein
MLLTRDLLKSHRIPCLALLAITVITYCGIFQHDFVRTWDDDVYVTANEAIRGFSIDHLRLALTRFYAGNYAPVQIISYMLDYTLWGLNATGFLLANLLYHAANGILFYALVIRLHGNRSLAFLAALIFLCHPVQVESVAWVSQRKNLLSMLFFLGSFHCYLSYRLRPSAGSYTASLLGFVLALLAKAVAIVLAPALLLYDFCFTAPTSWSRTILNKVPFAAAAALVSALTYVSQAPGLAPYFGGSPLATCYTMLPVFVRYLRMTVWPSDLCASYTLPIRGGIDLAVLGSALFLAALAGAGFWLYRRRRDLFFWFVFFFLGLLPVSQIIPIMTLMNDRYLYFPMLGAALLLAQGLLCAVEWAKGRAGRIALGCVAAVLGVMCLVSFRQTRVWSNSLSLWTDVTGKYPGDADAWNALGDAQLEAGGPGSALSSFRSAIEACTAQGNCHYYEPTFEKIGDLYLASGQLAEGTAYFTDRVQVSPTPAQFNQLAKLSFQAGDAVLATRYLEQALALDPANPQSLGLKQKFAAATTAH